MGTFKFLNLVPQESFIIQQFRTQAQVAFKKIILAQQEINVFASKNV